MSRAENVVRTHTGPANGTMKQRFSSLDVQVIAHELSSRLTSLRLANVYDLSSRIFLLKFQKPDHREQLVVDSGFRCHLSQFARATAAAPSPFVVRLRKFLRTRRCTGVRQIGTDRVIELTFSHADGVYRLFLEFYAGGNVILTDNDFTILGLLRSVSEGAEHEQYRAGLKYNLSLRQNAGGVPDLTKAWLKAALQKTVAKQTEQANKPGKKIKKNTGHALRKALAVTTTQFPPVLLDHAIHVSQISRELEPEQVVDSDELLEQVLQALRVAESVVQNITSQPVAKGYILAQRKTPDQGRESSNDNADVDDDSRSLMYEDFHPFKPAQLAEDASNVFLEHDGFNFAVDEFFSSIEGQKLESKLAEKEENAKKRIEYAKKEQEQRINGLQQVQELHVRKAQAIEANVERVEEATAAVNGLIAQGMDWEDIGRLIEQEQKRHNAVAELIKLPLKLHENTMTLLLSELGDEDDDDEDANETDSEPSDSDDEQSKPAPAQHEDKRLTIDIDLGESAWVNARRYYDQKRSAAVKQEKTVLASKKAIKSTEQKVQAQLKKDLKQEKDVLRPVRKQFWFEKFIYFISSDGYLVLAGKDAQQNEILYRRHLKKGDVYIHADLQGAASVIVKNKLNPEDPLPPSTLAQAGDLAVCTSTAWDNKAVMSAWWVNAEQVSKTAPTGEYLAAGGFVIKGKKNFLPPAKLLLGFGVMFQISEESKARHLKHRLELPRQNSYMATPELTEAETAADTSAAGSASDDDEFPDAAGSSLKIEDNGDDDEFPDVSHQANDVSSDESPDEQRRRTYGGNEDAEDDDLDHIFRTRPRNPLQSAGFTSSPVLTEHADTNDEDEDPDLHHNDETESTSRPTSPDAAAANAADASARSIPADAEGQESDQDEQPAQPQLSNKARKELARIQKGKPAQPALPSQKPTRGQRGKKKKIATKYANQDEEDRALAMQLLGSKASDERRAAEAAVKAEKKETEEEARARRKAQHERAQQKGLEAEEMRKLTLDEGIEDDGGAETDTVGLIESLVGQPLPGDALLEAIPTVAPWAALARYKYKVKLQPGQQKKGKATREILNRWLRDAADERKLDRSSKDSERIWPREAELVKGWREPEVIGVLPVKSVRVMMSNASGDKAKSGSARGGKGGRGGKGSKKR